MALTSAPTMLSDTVALWRHAIEAMPTDRPPCRYLTPARWASMRESATDFTDRFGAEAHRLGWRAPELFGVHPDHGTQRLDSCGALTLGAKRATAVKADWVVFERTAAYRNGPGQVWGPPIWEFAARGKGA